MTHKLPKLNPSSDLSAVPANRVEGGRKGPRVSRRRCRTREGESERTRTVEPKELSSDNVRVILEPPVLVSVENDEGLGRSIGRGRGEEGKEGERGQRGFASTLQGYVLLKDRVSTQRGSSRSRFIGLESVGCEHGEGILLAVRRDEGRERETFVQLVRLRKKRRETD